MNNTPEEAELKYQMIYDGLVILKSIEWAENEMRKVLRDAIIAKERQDLPALDALNRQALLISKRIDNEDNNIRAYIKKYKGLINEKKASLPNSRKKK